VCHGAVRCWRLVLLPKSFLRAFFLLLSDVLISQPTTDTVEKDLSFKQAKRSIAPISLKPCDMRNPRKGNYLFYVPSSSCNRQKLEAAEKSHECSWGQVTNQVSSTCVIGTNPEMRHVISCKEDISTCVAYGRVSRPNLEPQMVWGLRYAQAPVSDHIELYHQMIIYY